MKSPSTTLEVAEQREKRVLIQMSVLVLAFLLMCAPFFITFAVMHWCQPSPSMFEEVRKLNFCEIKEPFLYFYFSL